jgi:Zn-dependent protease
MKTWKKVAFVMGILGSFLVSFMANVFLHELGHYAAADSFGLNPDMELGDLRGSINFSLESRALAYTEFDYTENKLEMFTVTVMGPLVNLVLSLVFLVVYVLGKKNEFVRMIALAGFLPALLSFVFNVLPLSGTDGAFIVGLLG